MNLIKDILIPFLIGGVVVALTVVLANHASPMVAGISYWYPIVFITSVLLMKDHEVSNDFAKNALPAGFMIFLYIAIYYLLTKKYPGNIWSNQAITTIIWLIFVVIYYKICYSK